jgi:protein tyrosine phosphatase
MVWDHKVKLIVMCCPVTGNSTEESLEYWEEKNMQKQQRVRVVQVETKMNEGLIERQITLQHQISGEIRQVRHLQMDCWQDD